MEAVQTQKLEKLDTKTEIKKHLDSISESIGTLRERGLPTEQIYEMFDTLKYDVLSDDSIATIGSSAQVEEIIKYLNSLDIALSDLTKQIVSIYEKRQESENKSQELLEEQRNVRKPYQYYIGKGDIIFNTGVILTAIAAAAGVMTAFKGELTVPETIEISMDTEGNYDESTAHYAPIGEGQLLKKDSTRIVECFPTDESGFRKTREYYLDTTNPLPEGYDLNKVDLSGLNYIENYSYNEDLNNVSNDYFRSYQFVKNDYSKMERWENHTSYSILADTIVITLQILSAAVIYALSYLIAFESGLDPLPDFLNNLRENLGGLIHYKLRLSRLKKDIQESEETKRKYGELVDSLLHKTDELIQSTSERIEQLDDLKMLYDLREARKREAKVNAEKEKLEQEKEQAAKEFMVAAGIINNVGEKLKELDPEKYKAFLHSIPITETSLFEPFEDHLVIKEGYKAILPYLDLSGIFFDNVDIRNINWEDTNASILIKTVYHQDASGCIMGDHNLHNFQDYGSAILKGAQLKEDPATMIAYEQSIKDENTRVVPVQK